MFSSAGWTYEPKWDGFRVLATIRDGHVRHLDALRGFPTSILLDGEVIVINDRSQPDFEALQARPRPRNGKLSGYLCYVVFDCLRANGHSVLNRSLNSSAKGTPHLGANGRRNKE